MTNRTTLGLRLRLVLGIGAAVIAGLAAPAVAGSMASAPAMASGAGTSLDKLILRNGKIYEGEVVEETDTTIRFKLVVGGLSAERVFDRSEVLSIERGEGAERVPADGAAPERPATGPADPARVEDDGRTKVYVIELKGKFGEDISQSPVREAVEDAKRYSPDYLIVVLDNDWAMFEGMVELPDDPEAAEFDQLFRAVEIAPVLTSELQRTWDKPPKVVFWVKQAMGGAAFLPFISDTIFVHPEARWGGVGNLSIMFGSMGDEEVRQKQYSLRMATAEGLANLGGHDYRLLRAMSRIEYVLSVRYDGGRPVYLERAPESVDEYLLTDDGKEDRADTVRQRATGEGNDVLTLTAELAQKLGVARGVAETLDDVLFGLGIARVAHVVDGRSAKIVEDWSRGLAESKRQLKRLMREYGSIQVQGDYTERSRGRSRQISTLESMLKIYKRYGESIAMAWRGQNGVLSEPDIRLLIDQIRLQQLRDRR